MKGKKRTDLTVVVLYTLCAVLWTIRAILEIAYKTYNESVFWFVLSILCAVLWIGAAIVQYRRYRAHRESR